MGECKFERWLTPDGLLLLEGWARDGLEDKQIAHNCGCSRDTLKHWKKRFPEIKAALEKGREPVDYQVENAVLQRALGYEYTETKTTVGETETMTTTQKFMPPNVQAAKFWLQRRKPEKWGDTPQKENGDENASGCILIPAVKEDE